LSFVINAPKNNNLKIKAQFYMNLNNSSENKVWYAVYTRSRTEKKVRAELEAKNIELKKVN